MDSNGCCLNKRWFRFGLFALMASVSVGVVQAHTPTIDAYLKDWCVGAFSNTAPGGGRTEDSGVTLICGFCSNDNGQACEVNSDCPVGGTCMATESKTEIAWWDARKDGAVNDLATLVVTQDASFLYFAAELWVYPDRVSLPFGMIALDTRPGGFNLWHDPNNALTAPGHCSEFTDRACTSNADCHFCQISTEPLGDRVRTCGSGCDPGIGDVCDMSQTCLDIGTALAQAVGADSNSGAWPDYLVIFDFSRWLLGSNGSTLVMENIVGDWVPIGTVEPAVNPGQPGGSGSPPGSVEVAIPWSVFGGGFLPGEPFTFNMIISRGTLTLDYTPDGAIEDLMSEKVPGTTTATQDSCCATGTIATTLCEIVDGSSDAFIPRAPDTAGGRCGCLTVGKAGGSSITVEWCPSCSEADNDYALYEGTIGSWYSHAIIPGLCTTAGATTATVAPASGDTYYLAVPSNGATEGSYGEDSFGAERSPAAPACHPQVLGSCP